MKESPAADCTLNHSTLRSLPLCRSPGCLADGVSQFHLVRTGLPYLLKNSVISCKGLICVLKEKQAERQRAWQRGSALLSSPETVVTS